jgi:hypothetical protein
MSELSLRAFFEPSHPCVEMELVWSVADELAQLHSYRLQSDRYERMRTGISKIATRLDLVHLSVTFAELRADRHDRPEEDNFREAAIVASLNVDEVLAANSDVVRTLLERGRGREHPVRPSREVPDLDMLAAAIEKLTSKFELDVVKQACVELDTPEVCSRIICTHEALCRFVARHDRWTERSVRILGVDYCAGRLPLQELAKLLSLSIPDTIVRLEQCGYSRPLEAIKLSEAERDEAFARMRQDRQRRGGTAEASASAIARDVIASQRIEGIDARRAFRDVVGVEQCSTNTSTP